MSGESVSILIPTHNRRDVLVRTLASLRALQIPAGVDVELVVVANACTDDTFAMVTREAGSMPFPTTCVIEPQAGLSIARNRCLLEARHEIMAFLDDDVWVEPGWLHGLLEVFQGYPADMVGGRVLLWWEAVAEPEWMSPFIEDRISANDQGNDVREYSGGKLAIGANIAFRRTVFERIGTFRVGLGRTGVGLLGGEETELVDRAVSVGMRLFYAPNAIVKHWVSPHRITNPYLSGVAYAAGQTGIFGLKRFGPGDVLYQIAGRLARLMFHGGVELLAMIRRDHRSVMVNRSHRAQAMGGFAGIVQRLRGRSPVAPNAPMTPLPPKDASGPPVPGASSKSAVTS